MVVAFFPEAAMKEEIQHAADTDYLERKQPPREV